MDTPSSERKPWVAVVLSLLCTGLGHIYCGRIVLGLVLFLSARLFGPIAVGLASLAPSTTVLVALLLATVGVLGIYLFALFDAYRQAKKSTRDYELREFNRGWLYALFIMVSLTVYWGSPAFVKAQGFEAFSIPARSMTPTVLKGDYVLVNKRIYRRNAPGRGDLVVFLSPDDRRQTYIKRVVGLPGDSVAVIGIEVYVNGKKLKRDRVPISSLSEIQGRIDGDVFYEQNAGTRYLVMVGANSDPLPDYPETTVPEGSCFLLGDNRDRSKDSRHFGFVPIGDLLGASQYIYFPAETWSRFGAIPQ